MSVPVIVRDELKERDFDDMTGKTWDEMAHVMKMESVNVRRKDFTRNMIIKYTVENLFQMSAGVF